MTAVYNKIIWNLLATVKLKVLVIDFIVSEWFFFYLPFLECSCFLVCFPSLNVISVLCSSSVHYLIVWQRNHESCPCSTCIDVTSMEGGGICSSIGNYDSGTPHKPKWPQNSPSQPGIHGFQARPWEPIKMNPIWNL